MLKPYSELIKVDVTPYCEERDGMLYLNWAMCIKLLHDNGAEKYTGNLSRTKRQEAASILRILLLRTRMA